MYLEILILSHLRSEPVHGYELKRKVSETTAFALHNNTLYPALRRFEEAGAVRKTAVAQEGRPPRHVYELTATGEELLHDMVSELPPELAGDETEFLARVGLFDELTPAERRAVLDARDATLHQRVQHLEQMGKRAESSRRTWGWRVTQELVARAHREREWIAELRKRAGR
jgi:DNA-binding PadR family transcriptional regulator